SHLSSVGVPRREEIAARDIFQAVGRMGKDKIIAVGGALHLFPLPENIVVKACKPYSPLGFKALVFENLKARIFHNFPVSVGSSAAVVVIAVYAQLKRRRKT